MRLFRLISLVMLLSAVPLLAARWIGSTRTISQLSAVMSTPNGTACERACLFGVLPGDTSFEQAVLLLRSHPLTQPATWLNSRTLKLPGPDAYVSFSLTPDGIVDSITFTDNMGDTGISVPGSLVDAILLGDLLAAYEVPNVYLPGSPYATVNFRTAGITVALARPQNGRWHIESDTPLSSLMVSVVRTCPEAPNAGGEALLVHPWMGFTTIRRYSGDRRMSSVMYRLSGVDIPPMTQCQP